MKRLPWKYLAGLIDGEACIDVQLTKRPKTSKFDGDMYYVRPRVRIAMVTSAKFMLDMMANSCPPSGTPHITNRSQKNPAWQDSIAYDWSGYGRACSLLRNVVNHLYLKREQARFCLWLEQNIKGKQVTTEVKDVIREELKLMKRDPHRLSEKAQGRILEML